MAQSENLYNSDKTRRSCPHGASVDYPVGTVEHVKVGDKNCVLCPCFQQFEKPVEQEGYTKIICCYPHFKSESGNERT